ncbi:RNA-dependent RNA polymerase [Ganoderma sinense ZZ0214-1]|uniref:RNA-dependent RNA polymerase n=1 Tax=Ganoderma sinense ZZ0214-1 TaxID=1077348 RepID=A0A2G8SBP5_9APHY|nr:RNA-dependent RNA polymerase [Ganoderma sinense ZZ0214-1]
MAQLTVANQSDAESEFWTGDSVSQAHNFLRMCATSPVQDLGRNSRDRTSPEKRTPRPAKITSERGIGTRGDAPRPERRTPRTRNPHGVDSARRNAGPSSAPRPPNSRNGGQAHASDSEASVEAMIETESESSEPASRAPSFAFSTIESRNSSLTSLSSSTSVDSTTGRKRAMPYEQTYGQPIAAIAARKTPRTAQKATPSPATKVPHTSAGLGNMTRTHRTESVPQTPSRSGRIAGTHANRDESPHAYRSRVDTPTTSRISNALEKTVIFNDETEANSASAGPSRHRKLDPSTLSGTHIVAHSKDAQKLFDSIPLSWGVQYEIARGVSRGLWSWETVMQSEAALRSLSGTNMNASKVSQALERSLGDVFPSDAALWYELDREDAAIIEGRGRGLGLQGDFMEQPNWYGGRIQQVVRLEEENNGSFRLVLAKMEMRKSCRTARFLGSRRMLQVSIPQNVVNNRGDDLRAFFTQKFILCGRVFVAFLPKDKKIFLMEIPEDYERGRRAPGDERRITLTDFIAWHNSMERNGTQPVSKWATRFDLGFSISVPVLHIPQENVFHMADEVAPFDEPNKKPPAECIYTDGCGWMNNAALSAIARHMALEERPTAVQGRFGGAKGLWVLHPRDQSSTPKIWIRESQVKIKLDFNDLHPAHSIFDLLAPPRVTLPSRLSRLTILNLAHNGVPKETFVELMRETIEAEVKPLVQWTGPKAMALLWKAIEKVGGVAMKRALQHAVGTSRAMGLVSRSFQDYIEGEEPNEPLEEIAQEIAEQEGEGNGEKSALYTALRDPATGQPLTIHGVILDLLQAGFQPLKLESLYEKLKKVTKMVVEDIIHEYHISVPLSAEAFIVPDPYGVLNEGEIHFKSTKLLKEVGDLNPNLLLGDVLIYRNPNRLPSDVQKVTAVQCDQLAAYTDVIVLPTVGSRSFASLLAGGDYDGDVAVVIYDERLVNDFRTPPLTREPPNFIKDNFEDMGTIQQVNDLATDLTGLVNDPNEHRRRLQQSLLLGLTLPPIGIYSQFHEGSAFAFGYDSPETIRHAFMFNTVLDSRKTGHRVSEDVFKKDKRNFNKEMPPCLQSRKSGENPQERGDRKVSFKRDRALGPFILDYLFDAGRKMQDEHMKRYDGMKPRFFGSDADLLRPWDRMKAWIGDTSPVGADLALIQAHVNEHIRQWQVITGRMSSSRSTPSARGKAGARSGKSAQALYDELARSYAAGPEISSSSLLACSANIEQLKASCAYALKPKFAWYVAFQALCHIKAAAEGSIAFKAEFADLMSIPASTNRVLEQSRLALTSQ